MTSLFPRTARCSVAAFAAVGAVISVGLASLAPTTAYADSAPAKAAKRNLLRAHSFTDHGYAEVTTYDNWEGDGDFELGACGMTRSDASPGYVNQRFRMYVGAQTSSEQVVVQFRTRGDAADYVREYRDAVRGCVTYTDQAVEFSGVHRPAVDGVTSARWWSTHSDQGVTRSWGTLSLVRTGSRVSVLTMTSTTSKPRTTMDVAALMQDMADRLVLD